MFLSLDFLLLLCEFSIVLDKVFSISGGKYIIEVDVRCDSGIAVSICCQKGSSPESPEFSWSEMDVCRFTRFDCLFSRSPPTPPPLAPEHLFLLGCDCAVESQVLHMRCGVQLLFGTAERVQTAVRSCGLCSCVSVL